MHASAIGALHLEEVHVLDRLRIPQDIVPAPADVAIVLVAINGVFATAVRLRDKTSEAVEEALPVNRAMEMMVRDLKGTVGPGGFLAGDFRCGAQAMGATMGLSGEAGSAGLDFFTSTGAVGMGSVLKASRPALGPGGRGGSKVRL